MNLVPRGRNHLVVVAATADLAPSRAEDPEDCADQDENDADGPQDGETRKQPDEQQYQPEDDQWTCSFVKGARRLPRFAANESRRRADLPGERESEPEPAQRHRRSTASPALRAITADRHSANRRCRDSLVSIAGTR